MLTALVLAFACGLSPYLPVVMFGAAARSNLGPPIRPELQFIQSWEFLGPMLALVGLDIVLDKLPATARIFTRLGWLLRPAAAGLLLISIAGPSTPVVAAGIAAAVVLASASYWLRLRLIHNLGRRFYGLERFSVSAYGEIGAALVALSALLAPPIGVFVAGLLAALAILLIRALGPSVPPPAPHVQ